MYSKKLYQQNLTPESIFLGSHNHPHLFPSYYPDFNSDNISSLRKNESAQIYQTNNPLYLAPEIIRGETSFSEKANVFAFSMIVYEILCGRKPFPNCRNIFSIANNIEKGDRPDLSVIKNDGMRLLLKYTWSDNPSLRLSFDQIVNYLYTVLNRQQEMKHGDEAIHKDKVKVYLHSIKNEPPNTLSFKLKKENPQPLIKVIADSGNAEAMFQYALMSYKGEEIEQNYSEAIKYYKKAIKQGHSLAMYKYGRMLHKGRGVSCNTTKAVIQYKKAIRNGNVQAMYIYGGMLEYGKEVPQDYVESAKLYKMAADLGFADACYDYAIVNINGQGVTQDFTEAIKYLKKGIDLGDKDSMYQYAKLLEKGNGSQQNYKEAAKYYRIAAKLGKSDAMYRYALLLEKGNGIHQDIFKAKKYYNKAITLGNPRAMYSYACLLESEGCHDLAKITKLITIASEMGYEKAIIHLCDLKHSNMIPDHPNFDSLV
ncbi:hypothetical protein TRFO_21736 [Tritrichomonas foetus]|uniref:Protein kinase domain-containing protein n=1 Tax=Tritrichomonas foetus TaxID=1144522 RepID=A0A1J4KD39_9EUKA|nr:hypothetical protein TRFO_21736 [Tritrichomonas foetus]|eukprot:OHT09343.1 hypothetical protein TRFO_21736 [Tritrichomonas foetus]